MAYNSCPFVLIPPGDYSAEMGLEICENVLNMASQSVFFSQVDIENIENIENIEKQGFQGGLLVTLDCLRHTSATWAHGSPLDKKQKETQVLVG